MPGMLSRFRIEALHNRYTIDVPIEDNKLVLIGENGTGKSTVTNFMYFFLTRQWHRMLAYDFERVVATIDSRDIEVTRKGLSKRRVLPESDTAYSFLKRYPSRIRSRIFELIETNTIEDLLNHPGIIAASAIELDMPRAVLSDILERIATTYTFPSESTSKTVQSLKNLFSDHILYLPTYRRIEQDLSAIFPDLALPPDFRYSIDRLKRKIPSSGYIELVQFGMQDVEETIQNAMKNLSDRWRDDLSKLMGTYLRDVIQGVYKSAEPMEIGELDDIAINDILNRIDQVVLPQPEQNRLREMVAKIKDNSYIPDNDDKVVVHFLTRLIKLHRDQQAKERNVREFVNVCNQYLTGKEILYDNMSFEIIIRQDGNFIQDKSESTLRQLKMSALSSGEKQIVSLFSQIYLSDRSNYFVIIDEPELSLSVLWQKRFLPDILNSGRCNGLIAVTHSPFICENELDAYMRPIELFMEPVDAKH